MDEFTSCQAVWPDRPAVVARTKIALIACGRQSIRQPLIMGAKQASLPDHETPVIRRTEAVIKMRHCAICGKHPSVGNNVSHARNRTKRRWLPSLQRVRAKVGTGAGRLVVCTRCIRAGKVVKAV